jgi:hypothetical protein
MGTVFEASYTELKNMEAERDTLLSALRLSDACRAHAEEECERLTDHRDALQGQVKGACETIERLRAALLRIAEFKCDEGDEIDDAHTCAKIAIVALGVNEQNARENLKVGQLPEDARRDIERGEMSPEHDHLNKLLDK